MTDAASIKDHIVLVKQHENCSIIEKAETVQVYVLQYL